MPALAAYNDGEYKGSYVLFCYFLVIAGIDSAFSYVEALVTNIIDQWKWNRIVASAAVTALGLAISLIFCTGAGWVIFDLVDHYISSYIVISIGLMQCISVGWLFEHETTAIVSRGHRASLKWMGTIYWFVTVVVCFYANFGFTDHKWVGFILLVLGAFISLAASFSKSEMSLRSWYHEIVLCGVDKVSMSITILSNPKGERKWWMIPFEFWFGMCIKFVAPMALTWLLFENLAADLASPYAEQHSMMQMYSSIFVFVTILMIFGPMFLCDYPEVFSHNVNLEFNADNIYAENLRKKKNAVSSVEMS